MKKININKNTRGIYYIRKQLLKFEKPNECLDDEDMINLFLGFIRLIKRSIEVETEGKYLSEIKHLKNKLKNFEK